jgi:N-acetylmuramoyl-L-alanine amidase
VLGEVVAGAGVGDGGGVPCAPGEGLTVGDKRDGAEGLARSQDTRSKEIRPVTIVDRRKALRLTIGIMKRLHATTVRAVALVALVTVPACSTKTAAPPVAENTNSPSPSASVEHSPPPSPEPSSTPTVGDEIPVLPISAPGVLRVGPAGAALATSPGGRAAGRLRAGILVPFTAIESGWARILTPCELTRWMPVDAGIHLSRPQAVLDPGHGGDERGAVGSGGLDEKSVNLDVASRAADLLAAQGILAILTRTADYRATLGFRVALAKAVRPDILLSIHHNADPDGRMDRPGSETYYQFGLADSKRLAGLMLEEAIRALSPLGADWAGDTDAGAKWRLNSRGGDYYGILRLARASGVTAVLVEMAFVSNPSEEALLLRDDTRGLEASAVAQAVIRYLRSKDPGSGFTTPYPRTEAAGPGGGRQGCTDPS